MMITEVVLFGYFMTCVCADGVADVVLSCTLVEDGVGHHGMGAAFTRTPATLVFKDVAVAPEESLETLTQFVPPSVPDPDLILFEAQVSSVEFPGADVLLHADCNEQETTVVEKDHTTLMQSKLGLPLSQSGCLPTEVIFLVFSHVKSVNAPLSGEVLLNCGFKQHEKVSSLDVGIEWRMQHRGKGHKVFDMKTRLDDAEGNTVVHAERTGSSMDASGVAGEGNVSVTLNKVQVSDEGSYICTVTSGLFHAQQVIQLHVTQPPHVSLSEEQLVLKKESPQTLSCHCSNYYPLDAQMEWLSMSPTDTEPAVFPDQGSLSSHRQHSDRTYSLSSHLAVPPTVPPGTKIICRVSHPALDAPLSLSVEVQSPEQDSYLIVLGFLIVTVIFFYNLMR
ncbi:unnamed protein product [Pleuronectes platessa]|uniref:Ig-like domain-containing protein n=1 Tax=Pleuronectes platessa TaxID=8262 RepID=A0A9N7ZC46_PLEPL|nr:unnamed protein product [Pleuronectes platessa]